MQELYDVQSLYGVMQWICMPPILLIYIFSCTDVQYSTSVHDCELQTTSQQVPGPVKRRIYSVPIGSFPSHGTPLQYIKPNMFCTLHLPFLCCIVLVCCSLIYCVFFYTTVTLCRIDTIQL